MVNRNLIHSLEDDAIELEMGELFSTTAQEDLEELNLTELYYPDGVGAEQKYELNEIAEGNQELLGLFYPSLCKQTSHWRIGIDGIVSSHI